MSACSIITPQLQKEVKPMHPTGRPESWTRWSMVPGC